MFNTCCLLFLWRRQKTCAALKPTEPSAYSLLMGWVLPKTQVLEDITLPCAMQRAIAKWWASQVQLYPKPGPKNTFWLYVQKIIKPKSIFWARLWVQLDLTDPSFGYSPLHGAGRGLSLLFVRQIVNSLEDALLRLLTHHFLRVTSRAGFEMSALAHLF